MTALTQERRDGMRAFWEPQPGGEFVIELLDALDAVEARAAAAEQDRNHWRQSLLVEQRERELAEQDTADWRTLAEDRWAAVALSLSERDALQAKLNAALKSLSSPHASLRRIAEARRALTPPKAESDEVALCNVCLLPTPSGRCPEHGEPKAEPETGEPNQTMYDVERHDERCMFVAMGRACDPSRHGDTYLTDPPKALALADPPKAEPETGTCEHGRTICQCYGDETGSPSWSPQPKAEPETGCRCEPCPGRGNDGHGMTHCAECCWGTGVIADIDCPIHGDQKAEPETGEQP